MIINIKYFKLCRQYHHFHCPLQPRHHHFRLNHKIIFLQSPRHLHTPVHYIESTLHWQEFVQFVIRHVQVISSSTDSGAGWFSIHTTELIIFPLPTMTNRGWNIKSSLPYVCLIIRTYNMLGQLILCWWQLMWFRRIFHKELSMTYFVYICFIWHSIEMTKRFFNFLKHIYIDSYCISRLGYTSQILFLLLNSTQPLFFYFSINSAYKKLLGWRYHYQLWKLWYQNSKHFLRTA